jgi:hypothetical protein
MNLGLLRDGGQRQVLLLALKAQTGTKSFMHHERFSWFWWEKTA